ncbi:MAG: PLP-dependent cysteine synthase family protein [Pseudonocardiaceae bacterium]
MQPLIDHVSSVVSPVSPASPAQLVTSAARCHSLATLVGNTPVLWIDQPFVGGGKGFWAKLEGHNPGGMKDRPALHMIGCARQRGELEPGGMIVESTSGTLGLGLVLAGQVYDHPVTLVTDPGIEPIIKRLLTARGARVEMVTTAHSTGGWQEARRQRVGELLTDHPGSFCPDQYHNPDNVAGYSSLALELVAQLGRIDVLVCSVGTGGHSAGLSQVLREFFPHLRLIGVDTIGSTIFGQPARPRLMRGLGSSIYPRNVNYSCFDQVHWVPPSHAVSAARHLAVARYATGGWSVGAVALVAGWVARTESADTRIASIFPDGPYRYFDTIFNDDYCHRNGLLTESTPTEPDTLAHPEDREVTTWTRCDRIIDPLSAHSASQPAAGVRL